MSVAVEVAEAPCPNCATPLRGDYCHGCGQEAQLQNRTVAIARQFVEGLFHLDGRLWRTLKGVILTPGGLSRDWREGKRARHVPPLNFFLFATLTLLAASGLTGVSMVGFDFERLSHLEAGSWNEMSVRIAREPKAFTADVNAWSRRLAILVVPASALALAVLVGNRRGATFYDHVVVSLYGSSVFFLALAGVLILDRVADMRPVVGPPVLMMLGVHFLVHVRVAYDLTWGGALTRALAYGAAAAAYASAQLAIVLRLATYA